MTTAVVLPGIFGTELLIPAQGARPAKQIWFFTGMSASEVVTHLLTVDDLAVGKLLGSIGGCLQEAYDPLFEFLDPLAEASGGGLRIMPVPYDWRRDIRHSADVLADTLRAIGDDRIVVLGHSMGGLVARCVLEDARFRRMPFMSRITDFVSLAVPHLGAPLALYRVLGLDGLPCGFMPAHQFKRLSSQPAKYPGGHQLLPAPSFNCFDHPSGTVIDLYGDPAFKEGAVGAAGLQSARDLHRILEPYNRPPNVRYHVIAGQRQPTISRISVDARMSILPALHDDEGDGTVPLWSAMPAHRPAQTRMPVIADHIGILGSREVHQFLREVLTGDHELRQPSRNRAMAPPPAAAAARAASAAAAPGVQVFPAWRFVPPSTSLPVMLSAVGSPLVVKGSLSVEGRPVPGARKRSGAPAKVAVQSGGPVSSFSTSVQLPGKPGAYRLVFRPARGSGVAVVNADVTVIDLDPVRTERRRKVIDRARVRKR